MDWNQWVKTCQEWKEQWPTGLGSEEPKSEASIYDVIAIINDQMNKRDVIVTDAGSCSYALPVHLRALPKQRFIFSPAQADMGWAIPASIGVALRSHSRVICVVGDGSFMSNVQELATIAHHELPIMIIVLNNNGYMSIKNTQQTSYGREWGTDQDHGVGFPNIRKLADAFGIRYTYLGPDWVNLAPIIGNPTFGYPEIIEVICQPNEKIVPMQSFKVVDGKKVQAPLEEMFPFLSSEQLAAEKAKCK